MAGSQVLGPQGWGLKALGPKDLRLVQPSGHPGRQGCLEATLLWQHGWGGVPKPVIRARDTGSGGLTGGSSSEPGVDILATSRGKASLL